MSHLLQLGGEGYGHRHNEEVRAVLCWADLMVASLLI